jgi:hypothetical protein
MFQHPVTSLSVLQNFGPSAVAGWPVTTILRGKVIVENGKLARQEKRRRRRCRWAGPTAPAGREFAPSNAAMARLSLSLSCFKSATILCRSKIHSFLLIRQLNLACYFVLRQDLSRRVVSHT